MSRRACLKTRPATLMRPKRSRASGAYAPSPRAAPGASIRALRLKASTTMAHQAALTPNSPEGICPPAKSDFITPWAASLLPQRSR